MIHKVLMAYLVKKPEKHLSSVHWAYLTSILGFVNKTLKKYLALVNPNEKQLAKINKLRKMAHMPEISMNGELLTV